MAVTDSNSFYKYVEGRAQTGYKAALLVEENNVYSMLIASETVPSVFGQSESFDFDLLNSSTKGKVQGKQTLDDKDVEFLYHRDNVYRLSKLVGKTLNFITLTPDFVAHKFVGQISMRMNDASNDVLKGTYTITALSASSPALDGRAFTIKETLCFANAIPEKVMSTEKLNLDVVQTGVTTTVTVKKITGADNTEGAAATITAGSDGLYALTSLLPPLTGSGSNQTTTKGLYAFTVSDSAGTPAYAPWTTTVYVDVASL